MFILINSWIYSHFRFSSPTSEQWRTQFACTQFLTCENSYKTDPTRTSTFASVNFRTPSWQWVQDTAKSTYNPRTLTSNIDLNRAGIGLMEIVSEPDLRFVCDLLPLSFSSLKYLWLQFSGRSWSICTVSPITFTRTGIKWWKHGKGTLPSSFLQTFFFHILPFIGLPPMRCQYIRESQGWCTGHSLWS